MTLEETFDVLGLVEVEAFIAQQQEENLNLEFKTLDDTELNRDDRKNLAKCLSGFANSSGGLIVWGVDARKNSDGIDCACGRKEIIYLSKCLSRLNELTGSATSPIVEGVRHKIIEATGNKGFVATLVPASESGPHMAKLGEDRYFKRSGDSFYRMEHFDLEDMFGRRAKPLLTLQVRQSRSSVDKVVFVLSLKNSGRGVARSPYLSFKIPDGCRWYESGVDGNRHEGLPRLHSRNHTFLKYGSDATFVIHPQTEHEVCAIDFQPSLVANDSSKITIEYEVAADGMRLTASTAMGVVQT